MKTRLHMRLHTWLRSRHAKDVGNIRVGRAEVKPDASSHTWGVSEGNARGSLRRNRGTHEKHDKATATGSRSTGINAFARNSIVPGAPRITPP